MKLRKPIFLLRSLLLSGHGRADRLRPERHRHARRRTGLYDQEQAAFRRKEGGAHRRIPADAVYDQTDPGTGVRDQRQSQRSFLQIPARLRHPLRRTQSGTRPPARRPGALRLRRNPARAILFVPRRLHRGPALLDSIRRELPPGFLELYYRTYIFFYDCYGVFSGSSRPTTIGRFTGIRSGGISESRPIRPKPGSRPNNGC